MKNKIKASFNQIQADEELKESTKAFIKAQTRGYRAKKTAGYRYAISAAVCFLVLFIGTGWFYLTPTAQISIDINPSIELGVNRFDKVVSIDCFNQDGQNLVMDLDIRFQNYHNAIKQILENETVSALLCDDAVMTITVAGHHDTQTTRILSDMEICTAKHQNTYCYSSNIHDVNTAHNMGLSHGKYRVFLELRALDPTITPEQVKGMSMREIQNLIQSLSSNPSSAETQSNTNHGHKQHHKR